MTTLTRKGYGRIYCEKAEDIPVIMAIIEELDAFEYDYLPDDYITVYTDYPKTVYTGKFDALDIVAFTAECWKRGIKMWVYDAGHNDNF